MVTPIPITDHGGTSLFYPGTVNGQQWAEAQPGIGERYWVESAAAAKVTAVGASTRTVRIAAGRLSGMGVFDTMPTAIDLQLDNPASGTIYVTVVMRRTHQATNASVLTAVAGTSARAVASGLLHTAGTEDDQPLAVVQVTKDQNDVVVVDDLRAVGNSGDYEATSELVLTTAGYMDKPGYRIRIAGTEWLRLANNTWEKVSTPIVQASSFGSSDSGWSGAGTPNTSTMVRSGRHRTMFLEQRRNGGLIVPSSTGHIANVQTFTLAEADRPVSVAILSGLYLSPAGTDYSCTGMAWPGGTVELAHLTPGVTLAGASVGDWSLRLFGSWYTA